MALIHTLIALLLTVATQVGGVAWLVALVLRGTGPARVLRFSVIFLSFYAGLSVMVWAAAPVFGRVALPCFGAQTPGLRTERVAFCVANRIYVVPELADEMVAVAAVLAERGQEIRTLDAGFPLPMPIIPHLSHGAGRAVDTVLPFEDLRAPFGYFAFVQPEPADPRPCDGQAGALRWDLPGLQPPDVRLDEEVARAQIEAILDRPALSVLIEPHLEARLGFDSPRLRFQGCDAARHDDHLHIFLN